MNAQAKRPQSHSGIDNVVMNVYNKMKNLEDKYMDLANFYNKSISKDKE